MYFNLFERCYYLQNKVEADLLSPSDNEDCVYDHQKSNVSQFYLLQCCKYCVWGKHSVRLQYRDICYVSQT